MVYGSMWTFDIHHNPTMMRRATAEAQVLRWLHSFSWQYDSEPACTASWVWSSYMELSQLSFYEWFLYPCQNVLSERGSLDAELPLLLLRSQWWDWPGHQLVDLLLVLLVLCRDGVLCLLLHPLHKVLHVLKGIDLERHKTKRWFFQDMLTFSDIFGMVSTRQLPLSYFFNRVNCLV